MSVKRRFWRTVWYAGLACLVMCVHNFTIAPYNILLADAAVYALLFALAYGGGLEEGLICAIALAVFRRYIGAIEGYMLPVVGCVDALAVTVVFWMKSVRWYAAAPTLAVLYAATLVTGTAIAYTLVQNVAFFGAFRTALVDQFRPIISAIVGFLIATGFYHRSLIRKRKQADA